MLPSYFHEIGKIPLLTAEEEVEIAQRVQAGCEEARNRMITANLRLVVRISGEFAHSGLPMADLVSEGNLGLIKAVERFRPHKGSKFSSYAAWWIRQSMVRAVGEQRSSIQLNPAVVRKVSKLRAVAGTMAEALGREPTDDELSEELGLDAGSVERLKSVGSRPASIDAVVSDDSGTTVGSLIVDHAAEDPHEAVSDKDLGEEAMHLLVFLDAKERMVIVRRYGLEGSDACTLAQLGAELGCTRERVRQIQDAALKRMRQAFARRQAGRFLEVIDGSPLCDESPFAIQPATCAA